MAILWQKQVDGLHYQVRQAGNTRRLLTNGVFHSQYNPTHVLTGSVWDLLFLPALMPAQAPQRVLVLGVGGGAVIQQLNYFLQPAHIAGIELNEVHIDIARRFFNLRKANIHLYHGDAKVFVESYDGPPYDLVIDDLFHEEKGETERAIAFDRSWANALLALVKPQGLLVVNFAYTKQLRDALVYLNRCKSSYQFTTPYCTNAVGVFCRREIALTHFHERVGASEILQRATAKGRLRYKVRRV